MPQPGDLGRSAHWGHTWHLNQDEQVADKLLQGVLTADAGLIGTCFAENARLRALIPPGLVERSGAAAAGELIASWFVDCDPVTLVNREVDRVSDRLHISYRLNGTEAGTEFTVQQQIYAEVIDHHLTDVTLLCSGFRPRTS